MMKESFEEIKVGDLLKNHAKKINNRKGSN